MKVDTQSTFFHFTSNEEEEGINLTQHALDRAPKGMTVVADMSTDFLTRQIDWNQYGVVYADAAHNIGPSGVTIVVVRHDLLGKPR